MSSELSADMTKAKSKLSQSAQLPWHNGFVLRHPKKEIAVIYLRSRSRRTFKLENYRTRHASEQTKYLTNNLFPYATEAGNPTWF